MANATGRYRLPRRWRAARRATDVLVFLTVFGAGFILTASMALLPAGIIVAAATTTALVLARVALALTWSLLARHRTIALWTSRGERDLIGAWSNQTLYGVDWRLLPDTTVSAQQYRAYFDAAGATAPVPLPAVEVLAAANVTAEQVRWLREYAPTTFRTLHDVAAAVHAGVDGQDLIPVGRAFHLSRVPLIAAALDRVGAPASDVAVLARRAPFVGMRLPARLSRAAETALAAQVVEQYEGAA